MFYAYDCESAEESVMCSMWVILRVHLDDSIFYWDHEETLTASLLKDCKTTRICGNV